MSDAATPQVDPRDMTIAEQANRIADLTKLVAEVTQENKQFREENKQLNLIRKAIKLVLQNHLLQQELVDNIECLFVFVEHPEVEPTNNRSERNARREAEIRNGARTSKSVAGAKRRSIIVTVLASLQTRIAKFTLKTCEDRQKKVHRIFKILVLLHFSVRRGSGCWWHSLSPFIVTLWTGAYTDGFPGSSIQRNSPLHCDGTGHFREISENAGPYFEGQQLGRGVTRSDFDGDGHPDLAVVHQDRSIALLRNKTANTGHSYSPARNR